MDDQNYVAPNPGGGFRVVVGGQLIGVYPTQGEAEQAYNAARGMSGAPPAGTPPPPAITPGMGAPGSSGGFNWPGLWGSMVGSNEQQFQEMIRQFNEQMRLQGQQLGLDEKRIDEMIRQFNESMAEQRRQFNAGLYSNLAQSLLSTSASLTGPADWLKYQEYTSGGRDIFKALTGDQAIPAFSAPTGTSRAMGLQDILAALGIPGLGSLQNGDSQLQMGAGSPASGTPPTPGQPPAGPPRPGDTEIAQWAQSIGLPLWVGQYYVDEFGYLPRSLDDLNQWLTERGYDSTGDPPARAATAAIPAAQPTAMSAAATPPAARSPLLDVLSGGTGNPFATSTGDLSLGQAPTPPSGGLGQLVPPVTGPVVGEPFNPGGRSALPRDSGPYTGPLDPVVPTPPEAPLPHQIHPAVWDSMSPTAKAMVLAAAGKGYTPSGAWDPSDYLRQMENARPKGYAPRQSNYNFGAQQSLF